ncbi:MAG: phage major capsid protein [Actinomycetota bacterium]|nr:phage major capsid protein [Actinomycetota bacterium]
MDVKTLRSTRAGILGSMKQMLDAAAADNRPLTKDEARTYDGLEQRLREVNFELDAEASGLNEVAERAPVTDAQAGEVRMNQPLRGRSFAELPGHSGSSVQEAGAWLRGLMFGNVELRALGEGTGAAGGFAVPTPVAAVILDRARAMAQVMRAGADVVPMTSDTLKIARVETDPTPTWHAENAQIPESDMTLGQVAFDSKTLAIITRVSRELLEDAPNVEDALVNALAQQFALELDRASLYGIGPGQPLGLRNVGGLEVVSLGANGAAPTNYGFIGRAIQRVRTRNYEPFGVILAHRTEGDLSNLTATDGQPLQPSGYVAAVPRYPTSQVPTNQAIGTGTNASELFVGDWAKLHVGIRTTFSVLPLKERYAEFGQVAFLGWLRADVQVSRIDAFSTVNGILATA